jgi:D-amino-acid dehydrogenase
MSGASGRAVVIGGGVIGTASAYFLARGGWQVTVIDQGNFGAGCSASNCGLICPSHILPLAEPGALGGALLSMFKKNSPLKVRLRFDPGLWAWLWKFAQRCNLRDLRAAVVGIQALLESSIALYPAIVERESLECEWERRGLLFAFRSPQQMNAYAETDRLMTEFNCPAQRFDSEAVRALEPALKPGLAGGWYYKHDAQLRPDRLMSAWRRALAAHGVAIREQCAFHGFRTAAGRAVAAETAQGEIVADAFVVAAGALTPTLDQHLGCRIPIQPGKGYSLTTPRPAVCPAIPLIFPETRVAVTPFQSGYRLGSLMEFGGYDTKLDPDRLKLLEEGARPYLLEPMGQPIEECWFGWRPMTYDGLPVIDRSPRLSNVAIAAGHNMLGMSMAPATGRLVAELLAGEKPHLDLTPYRVARF